MTDDFEFVTTVRTMNKQQCLDWVAGGGNPTIVSNQEILYENEEVAVVIQAANDPENNGQVMCCGKKRDSNFANGESYERLFQVSDPTSLIPNPRLHKPSDWAVGIFFVPMTRNIGMAPRARY